MTPQEIKNIAAIGEGYNYEFKVSLPAKVKELAEEVCAFANASGGVLLVGVADNNSIKGVSINNAKQSAIQNAISNISPAVECEMGNVDVDGKNVFYIKVATGKNKPHTLSGVIYVRYGPNSQKLTDSQQIREFFQQAGRIYFDEIPCPKFNQETDFDTTNFAEFRAEAKISSVVSDEQIISNLNLKTEGNHFNNGAVLFFGKNPETFIDSAYIRCVRYQGKTKVVLRDDKVKYGPLVQQYNQTIEWLKDKLEVGYIIEGTGPSKENWEIPKEVFKETIINALSHRDYYEKGACIMVEVFDDRVEISNPGNLLPAITPAQFGSKSLSRNPKILGLFNRMGLVEKVGSGVPRVRKLMQEKGLQEPVFEIEGMFSVTFFRPIKDTDKDTDNLIVDSLTKNQTKILGYMKEKPEITIIELAEIIGISSTAIEKNIKKLKEMKKIDRIGSDKTGLWKIL